MQFSYYGYFPVRTAMQTTSRNLVHLGCPVMIERQNVPCKTTVFPFTPTACKATSKKYLIVISLF